MPEIRSPQAFVAKWRDVTLKERSSSQEHFIDLCRLLSHPTLGAKSEKKLTQRTLTNLYTKRPAWLALAHEKLDTAVGINTGNWLTEAAKLSHRHNWRLSG